jgi:hypothetical protein
MSTRLMWKSLVVCGLTLALAVPATAAAPTPLDRPAVPSDELRRGADIEFPIDGRPIVATVIDVDDEAGRVTLDTPHGRVDLTVGRAFAGRLSPGDVVVLRITDDDSDFPSALPREEPRMPEPSNKI